MLTPFLQPEPKNDAWSVSVSLRSSSWLTEAKGPFTRLVIYPSTSIEVWRDRNTVILGQRKGTSARLDLRTRTAEIWLQRAIDNDSVKIASTIFIEILRLEGIYLFHCAAVEYKGKAVLLAAPSGGGKTTLACAWASIGNGSLMADDRCLMVRRKGQILCQGILSPVGLFSESERILSRLGCYLSQRRRPGQKDKLLYDAVKQGWRVQHQLFPIQAVVLLSPQLSPDAAPIRAAPSDLYEYLLRGSVYAGSPDIMQRQLDLAMSLVENFPLIRVSSRPKYPKVINELEHVIGGRRTRRPRPPGGPSPPILRRKAADVATRDLCNLLLEDQSIDEGVASDDDYWKPVLKIAEYHGLLPLLGHRLSSVGLLSSLSEGLRHVVKSSMETAQAGRLLHLHMIKQIHRRLSDINVPWCVMKGPAIAERAYNPPAARPYSDLDIIVPQTSKDIVQKAFLQLGFEPSEINSSLKRPDNRGEFVLVAHDPSRYVVEIHWDYVTGGSLRRFVSCDLEPVLERRTTLQVNGLKFPVTGIPDQMIGCCVHSAYAHQWNSLRQLLDIILIYRMMEDDDFTTARQIAGEWGVLNAVCVSILRAGQFFGTLPELFCRPSFPQALMNRALRMVASDDMTIRPWLRASRYRSRLARTMLRMRYV